MSRRVIMGKSKMSTGLVYDPEKFVLKLVIPANGDFTVPTQTGYSYNATIDWGDGSATSNVTGHNVNNTHTYSAGTYALQISGQFDSYYSNNSSAGRSYVDEVLSWGGVNFQGFTTMFGAFFGCENLRIVADGPIKERTAITNFGSCFLLCSRLNNLPANLFRYNTAATIFDNSFGTCSALTSVPNDLFKYNVNITTMSGMFAACSLLSNLPSTLLQYNINLSNIVNLFNGCASLTSIPIDFFRYNVAIDSADNLFNGCTNLTSIPADIFRYNTALASITGLFFGCNQLSAIPSDIFRYAVSVASFSNVFRSCSNLTTLPANLFYYNTAVTNYSNCFNGCSALQLRDDMFNTANFLDKSINWTSFALRTSFTGTQGTAQDIWSANYGTGTPNLGSSTTRPFDGNGNSTTSISNYASIPAGWK